MSADTRERPNDRFARMRRDFRVWRGQRPFWGGMLTLLAGIPIMYVPYQNLTLGDLTIRMSTTAGAGSLIIGILLVVLGISMWFQPHSRVFSGVAAILLALVSLVVSNFGAFLIGFLLGMIGGALCLSWAPGESSPRRPAHAAGKDDDAASAPHTGTGSALDDLSATAAPSFPATGADPNNANGRHRAG
ncbi:DUF6114 domain-containing protein [Streptomyces sp. TR06-5]|uniref:DUF6114 domain-containing protein n=1 Tax=unclassified Streptomyces TaxID=2593676 RepID=UPI0039A08D00